MAERTSGPARELGCADGARGRVQDFGCGWRWHHHCDCSGTSDLPRGVPRTVAAGASPMALKRGIDKAVEVAVGEIKRLSREVKGRHDCAGRHNQCQHDKQVGNINRRSDEEGRQGWRHHRRGSKTMETTLEVVEGMQFDRGIPLPYFVTDPERMECVLEDVYILIHAEEDQLDEGSAAVARADG